MARLHWFRCSRWMLMVFTAACTICCPTTPGVAQQAVPDDFSVRLRVARVEPSVPVRAEWRWGGEGLGGEVVRGELAPELQPGEWTPWASVADVWGKMTRRKFVTFTISRETGQGRARTRVPLKDVVMEFQFALGGKVIKSLSEPGPDGGTVGIAIPAHLLAEGKAPDSPEVLAEIEGISGYVQRRCRMLEQAPWAKEPVPRRYAIITDAGGYGEQSGYAIRHTSLGIVRDECRALRLLGVNGLRSGFEEAQKAGLGAEFRRAFIGHAIGFMVPERGPEAGCPFAPGLAEARATAAHEALQQLKQVPADEVWALTVDEIGAIAKEHLAQCPRCAEAFRAYLRGLGLAPRDFGKNAWDEIAPSMIWAAEGAAPELDFSSPSTALLAYYTSRFVIWASATAFTDLTKAARQADVFSYALRGPTPTWRGHSLDFFEFYDHSDTAVVFETSNRGPQAWQWESYMADICRGVAQRRGLGFGCYVKPHRGAPLQRMLSVAARGARMIYWYTYGPDYKKGDSFSQEPELLLRAGQATRVLAKAEDVLYGAKWPRRPEVAFVTPRSSEVWGRFVNLEHGSAMWEDAKWVYLALAHAHLPVDVLSEYDLAKDDLSQYKAIYIVGSHLRRDAAEAIKRWVEGGGTLWTDAGGLARDEGNQPLAALQPVLGLRDRRLPELRVSVPRYYATQLQPFSPAAAQLVGAAPTMSASALLPTGPFTLAVGREVLTPAEGTEALARFADGAVAATRHPFGRGQAVVLGSYQGLEYSAPLRRDDFDMRRDLNASARALIAAPALAVTQPVVEPSDPLVEGILVQGDAGRAVVLMNWAYRAAGEDEAEIEPVRELSVLLRSAGPIRAARSVSSGALKLSQQGQDVVIVLPQLAEGDVVLLQ